MDRSKARATEEANSRLERQSRELEAQAKLRHMCERAELDRCRLQMSEFVGPVRTVRTFHADARRSLRLSWCALLHFARAYRLTSVPVVMT